LIPVTALANAWYYLALTRTGSTLRLYVNGVNVATNTGLPAGGLLDRSSSYTPNVLGIGRKISDSPDYFTGSIDEVAVYNTALSDSRITAHYTAGRPAGFGPQGFAPLSVCQAPPTVTPTPTPTPTAFPTPTQGACIFHVSNPGVPGIGLAVRESPTKNSPRLDTIPWTYTQPLTAIYRIDIGSDRWYQVSNYNGYSAWIGAIVGTDTYVDNPNCTLPTPYPANWPTIAQIESAEIPTGCDIDAYLRTEAGELVLARVTFGEAASYNTSATVTPGDTSGGIVFTDALRVSWIIRMDAFMGLPNYGPQHSVAGRSVSITDMILAPGQFAPITDLRSALKTNGCNPSGIGTSQANVKRMVYPTNAQDRAELYQLWRIYQNIVISIINAQWSAMPSDIKGYEQFKGTAKADPCPAGADNLNRPGPGLSWATNQPYPPKTVYGFIDSRFGADQLRKTCYQDAYHLDDLFWAALIGNRPDLPQQPANTSSNIFPKEFCVAVLKNPDNEADVYPLAQLTGILNASPWPPGPCTIH